MKPISIIVPVYNEKGGLPDTVERLAVVLGKLPKESEVLLVDDGSKDGTRQWLEKFAEDAPAGFRVLYHHRNRGYGAALKTGLGKAAHNHTAICDADGTYPLEKLPAMARLMEQQGAAMIVGARPAKDQALSRRFAKAFLRRLAQYLAGEHIPDMNSGLRVFHRDDALRFGNLLPDGFSFTTTITMALMTEGRKVVFVPIRYAMRVGSSKIRPIRDTSNFLMLICRTALAFNPMKVFGPVGVLLTAIGVALLLMRLLLPHPVGVATTVIVLVAGLQVLAMGLLADLINRRR